jgi:hypothetical protein
VNEKIDGDESAFYVVHGVLTKVEPWRSSRPGVHVDAPGDSFAHLLNIRAAGDFRRLPAAHRHVPGLLWNLAHLMIGGISAATIRWSATSGHLLARHTVVERLDFQFPRPVEVVWPLFSARLPLNGPLIDDVPRPTEKLAENRSCPRIFGRGGEDGPKNRNHRLDHQQPARRSKTDVREGGWHRAAGDAIALPVVASLTAARQP